jgi:hypothetical protein
MTHELEAMGISPRLVTDDVEYESFEDDIDESEDEEQVGGKEQSFAPIVKYGGYNRQLQEVGEEKARDLQEGGEESDLQEGGEESDLQDGGEESD